MRACAAMSSTYNPSTVPAYRADGPRQGGQIVDGAVNH